MKSTRKTLLTLTKPNSGSSNQFSNIRPTLGWRIPLAWAMMGFAILGLLANLANVDLLLQPLDGRAATHPVTSFCLFSLGLCLLQIKHFRPTPLGYRCLMGIVALVSVLRLVHGAPIGSSMAGVNWVFGPWGPFHGRFSLEAACTLGAFSVAILLRRTRGPLGLGFFCVGVAVILNTLLEMTYRLVFFNGDVGAFTLLGLVCGSLAMVTLYINRPFLRVLFLVSEIGAQTRLLAGTTALICWVSGFAYYFYFDTSSQSTFVAGMISFMACSMILILLSTSVRHEASDAARRRAEREIARVGRTDPLTDALNRFGMNEALEAAHRAVISERQQYGVILIDLDHFKKINDTFGHDAGDDVLARVCATLRPYLRASDALGRWGGEEFLILLKIKDRGCLEGIAERLRFALDGLHSPYLKGANWEVSASFGISEIRADDERVSDAISRADIGLYRAKEQGRNRVVPCYDPAAA